MQIFSNLDMIAVFFLYILKSYKEKNPVEWIKAFSTLLRKKLFFVWLQLRVLSEINNEGEIKWTGPALTSKRNIWRIEQRQSSPVQCDQATTLSPDAACRLRNLIVEMISSQLAHKYRGRQTWGRRPSDMIRKLNRTTRLARLMAGPLPPIGSLSLSQVGLKERYVRI